ncbi:MAG: histidine phosphatase family protein [Roseateles asaccharophilus]|uniref:histidine phosphatase family protein n=1 Tax=Roseateles asaccharophilus TaxID=582607 RepID=UPI00391C2349
MGMLHLVRHGQASFGAADYDQLSPLGQQQCQRLGAFWRARGQRFNAVFSGTLKRHAQSLAALAEGWGGALPAVNIRPGLDEYDSAALIRAIHPEPLAAPRDAEGVKQHFRLLRQGLLAWMRGDSAPQGMRSHAEFSAGVLATLEEVRAMGGGEVLILSSGGPISCALAQVLQAPAESAIELNLRLRNSALSELVFNAQRLSLHSFNGLPHLQDEPALQSYA